MTGAPERAGAGAVVARRSATSTVRVRYFEVDRMKVAHHMHYLAWFEMGRTDLMREAGTPYRSIEEDWGVLFPVIEVGVRHRLPALYDDLLEVRTTLGEIAGARVRFDYALVRPKDSALLASGFTVHAAVDPEGRPRRMPPDLRRALEGWERAR